MPKTDQDAVRNATLKVQERIAKVSLIKFDNLPNKTIKSFREFNEGGSLLLTFTDGTMIVIKTEYWGCESELGVGSLSVEQAVKWDIVDVTELTAARDQSRRNQEAAETKISARKEIAQRKRRARQLIDSLHELVEVFGEDKVKQMVDGEEVSDLV